MTHRRTVLTALIVSWLASSGVRAQSLGKMARIGLLIPAEEPTGADTGARDQELTSLSSLPSPQRRAALVAGLRDHGWVEGRNLVIETRWAGIDPQRQRELAAELAALPVALIVTNGSTAIRAARDGAPGLPIVMINAGDPVGSGFVASLARPGGNLTGTSAAGEEVLGKQLELLALAAPQLKRVGVLMNRSNAANDFFFASMKSRAARLGLQLERIEVSTPEDLDDAVARARGGALVVLADPMFGHERVRMVGLIQRARAPAIFGRREFVAAGGLMSFVSSDAWHWREAASFVDKILRGTSPANLPVEQPTGFELSINLKTARALGLAMPKSLLMRADEVIE